MEGDAGEDERRCAHTRPTYTVHERRRVYDRVARAREGACDGTGQRGRGDAGIDGGERRARASHARPCDTQERRGGERLPHRGQIFGSNECVIKRDVCT